MKLFGIDRPVFAMLHLTGSSRESKLETAKREIDIYTRSGLDGIIVENYFGDEQDVVRALDYIRAIDFRLVLGLNVLHDDKLNFETARKYEVDFLQLDSVAGHLEAGRPDEDFARFMSESRDAFEGKVFGGVRFKYQAVKSGRTLEEDLRIGMTRCDAVVVTQDATGEETSMAKIQEFRSIIGDFPLVVGAGLTKENCERQLAIADAAIVGSYLKEGHAAENLVSEDNCKALMETVIKMREESR